MDKGKKVMEKGRNTEGESDRKEEREGRRKVHGALKQEEVWEKGKYKRNMEESCEKRSNLNIRSHSGIDEVQQVMERRGKEEK